MRRMIQSGAWLTTALAIASVAPALAHAQTVPDAKTGVEAWSRGDHEGAVAIWRKAAQAGDADAQFDLGQAYTLGNGVSKDPAMALSWFGKAAMRGHVEAQTNYGIALFRAGRRDEARPWLEKSVARGDPRAQLIYGTMLYNGDGVPRDMVRGYALIVRASASGLPQAASVQGQMDKTVSEADRRKGLDLARQYEAEQRRPALPPELAQPDQHVAIQTAPLPPSTPPRGSRSTPVAVAPAPRPAPVAATRPSGNWKLQLGAFGDPANAHRLWGQVGGRFAGRTPLYLKAGSLTRLLVGPYASKSEAEAACGAVKPCVPVVP
ncbi:MAG: SPOR domain-containing protein [Pseudomonadota bacterium]|nr:SPOR domain-containing protein [Pseudomonadota bacterium]